MSKSYATTKEGLEKLKRELDEIKSKTRPELADRIAKAKELGDLSENAEYHDAKEAMAFLEGHILELEDYISHAVIAEPTSTEVVTVGCRVRFEMDGKEREYWLVGSNESDPANKRISNESDVGRALVGRRKGNEFEAPINGNPRKFKILDIVCE